MPNAERIRLLEDHPDAAAARFAGETVNAQGQKTSSSYTAYCDGQDYPITGNPAVDAIEVRCIDSHTRERVNKKDGKVLSVARRVVSPDGNTMTVTTTRVDERGQTITSTTVYDRQ